MKTKNKQKWALFKKNIFLYVRERKKVSVGARTVRGQLPKVRSCHAAGCRDYTQAMTTMCKHLCSPRHLVGPLALTHCCPFGTEIIQSCDGRLKMRTGVKPPHQPRPRWVGGSGQTSSGATLSSNLSRTTAAQPGHRVRQQRAHKFHLESLGCQSLAELSARPF